MPTITGGNPTAQSSPFGSGFGFGLNPNWNNMSAPATQYQMNQSPDQTAWVGDTPGHQGQTYSYNPLTGEAGWVNSTQGLVLGSGNSVPGTGSSTNGAISYIDPTTGMQTLNLDYLASQLQGLAGGGGGNSAGMSGYNPYSMTEFDGGEITAPDAYAGGDWDIPKNVVNVHDVIESYRPQMEHEIAMGSAAAGNRLGQSGMAMSTPYATALGEVEQRGRDLMNQRAMEYQYDAGKFDAGNQMTGLLGKNAEAFNAWKQSGDWDMGAQGQNLDNAFKEWQLQNQYGFMDNQSQNEWNFADNMNQQSQDNYLQQLLGSIIGGML